MEEAEKLGVDIKDFSINIDDVDYIVYDLVFYKERWKKTTNYSETTGKKYTLEERYIVSFSFRQKAYHKYIRNKKLNVH